MKSSLIAFATVLCSLHGKPLTAQTAAADNKISVSGTYRPIPTGPSLFGVFQGRPPCQGIAGQLQLPTDIPCEMLKWSLILYREPLQLQPTTYSLSIVGGGDIVKQEGGSYRQKLLEGKWAIIRGMGSDPDAEVYRLETGRPGKYLYLWKGDENVLFILDEDKTPRVGNEDFSYTLNRVVLKQGQGKLK